MDKLSIANKRLKTVHDDQEREYEAQIAKLDEKERNLEERSNALDEKKLEIAKVNGNHDATGDDLVDVNAGGKIVSAKRSTLTKLRGTRLEALFSGRWDKKLQRDCRGRIFLDVNPAGFRAIVDYLNELTISSEDDPPNPPSVDDEHKQILMHQLELFGLNMPRNMPGSNIVKTAKEVNHLHDWLEEDDSDGDFNLLYRGSRDGLTAQSFHSKCDNQGCTLTIIETADGYVFGGYSNTPWTSDEGYHAANKAFLFVLSGSDISSPCKMKLKNANDTNGVYHYSGCGPTFGEGEDISVGGSNVYLNLGHTYASSIMGKLVSKNDGGKYAIFEIKEMEMFAITGIPSKSPTLTTPQKENQNQGAVSQVAPVTKFTKDVNEAINARQECLLQAESEVLHIEESFEGEQTFINAFASGDAKDVVSLNVSGTAMATKRTTLEIVKKSVLAQQFNDSGCAEQGYSSSSRAKEWTTDEVSAWAKKIHGIEDNVGSILEESKITGRKLLAMNMEGLKMAGIENVGTLCLLLEEIKLLKQASLDVATLIEHSPYCFGKILDYLRFKNLHSLGLVEEPALPTVCDLQWSRFEKVVKYYFPGESAKLILGDSN